MAGLIKINRSFIIHGEDTLPDTSNWQLTLAPAYVCTTYIVVCSTIYTDITDYLPTVWVVGVDECGGVGRLPKVPFERTYPTRVQWVDKKTQGYGVPRILGGGIMTAYSTKNINGYPEVLP